MANNLQDDRENLTNSENEAVQELLKQLQLRFSNYLKAYAYVQENGHQLLEMTLEADLATQRLEKDYDQFISVISTNLTEKKIEGRHATALLSLNGLLTQCFRQTFKLFEPLKQVESKLIHGNGNLVSGQ